MGVCAQSVSVEWRNGWVGGWAGGWMSEWMDGWMGGGGRWVRGKWMNGSMDEASLNPVYCTHSN